MDHRTLQNRYTYSRSLDQPFLAEDDPLPQVRMGGLVWGGGSKCIQNVIITTSPQHIDRAKASGETGTTSINKKAKWAENLPRPTVLAAPSRSFSLSSQSPVCSETGK